MTSSIFQGQQYAHAKKATIIGKAQPLTNVGTERMSVIREVAINQVPTVFLNGS